jgi:thymidylate kinase
MALIIAIEGIDAAGKNTHSKLLAERMGGVVQSFPDYTTLTGALILDHLKNRWSCVCIPEVTKTASVGISELHMEKILGESKVLDAMVFQGLQTINRLERRDEILRYLTQDNIPVVFDRYWVSAVVYGVLDGLDETWLRLINEKSMPSPDLWVLLDIPLEESVRRRPERRDRYETNGDFIRKVRDKYLEFFQARIAQWADPWQANWVIVNGVGNPDMRKEDRIGAVHERIAIEVEKRFGRSVWKK